MKINKVKFGFFVLLMALVLSFTTSSVEASVRVHSYFRKNGTYVHSYYRSNRDYSRFNNYSTRGNYNPYTGKKGYVNPYKW